MVQVDLPLLAFHGMIVDPPWDFRLYSDKGAKKSPKRHYRTMPDAEIAALNLGQHMAGDGICLLWAVWPKLPFALDCLKLWGFRYVTGGVWNKYTVNGKLTFGTGYVLRSACEPIVIGAVGRPKYGSHSIRNVINAVRREHSRKPDDQYEIIERLIPRGRYCEVFSRSNRPGWTSWGDQVGYFNQEDSGDA